MGDVDTGDLALLCHIYSLLFLNDGIVGMLIPGDPATLFYKTYDPFCVGILLRKLIQGLLCKLCPVLIHHSFCAVSARKAIICIRHEDTYKDASLAFYGKIKVYTFT